MADTEGGEEAVVDAFFEGVDEDGVAEVFVGVGVVLALGGGGEAELDGRGEVFEDAAPRAFVLGAAAMTFVDDDEVEEIGRVVAEVGAGFGFAGLGRAAHEGLEDGEEDAAVLWHFALLANVGRLDPHQRVLGEGGKGVVSLIR